MVTKHKFYIVSEDKSKLEFIGENKKMSKYKFELYAALGVNRDASPSEIKEAYRSLALKFHPDRNNCKGLERDIINEAMCGINEAYEILSNPEKRIDYDIRVKMGVKFPRPSFYKLVNNVASGEELDNSLEGKIGQLFSRGREIIGNVNSEQAKKVVNEVSSAVRVSVGLLRKVYQSYTEDDSKGKKVNRRV